MRFRRALGRRRNWDVSIAERIFRTAKNGTVKAILKAARGDWRGAIMVALYTVARLQDVADMRWESVDLQNKWIAFRAGKTKQRLKLPMHEALHEFLLELPAPDS